MLRIMLESDREEVYKMGYLEWGKNTPYALYSEDNLEEEMRGSRYVYSAEGKIVSSLVLYNLNELSEKVGTPVYGIASLVTKRRYRNKGYARKMMDEIFNYINKNERNASYILYSEIHPKFYEKLGFRDLPHHLQTDFSAVLMFLGCDDVFKKISVLNEEDLPDYF